MNNNPQKLHVAPPRECNPQLFSDFCGTDNNSPCNHHATNPIKASAIRRLEKIKSNSVGNHDATHTENRMQLLPDFDPPKVVPPEQGSSRLNWLWWIAEEVRLTSDDRAFIFARLATLPLAGAEAAAKRYVELWKRAADSEPVQHRKENSGRRAANLSLLYLVSS